MISKQQVITLKFTCDISKLLLKKNTFEPGTYVKSKIFKIDNYNCFLRFYPNGKNTSNNNKSSAYIVLNSNNNSILNDNRSVTTKIYCGNKSTKFTKQAKTYINGWGWSNFLNHKLLKVNMLTIKISISNNNIGTTTKSSLIQNGEILNTNNNINSSNNNDNNINNNDDIKQTLYYNDKMQKMYPLGPLHYALYPVYVNNQCNYNCNNNCNIEHISPLPFIDNDSDNESLSSYSTFPDIYDVPNDIPPILPQLNTLYSITSRNNKLNTPCTLNTDINKYNGNTTGDKQEYYTGDESLFESQSTSSTNSTNNNSDIDSKNDTKYLYIPKKKIDFNLSSIDIKSPIIFSDSDNDNNNNNNDDDNNNDTNIYYYSDEGGNVIELELDNCNITKKDMYNYFSANLKPIKINLNNNIAEVIFENSKITKKAYQSLLSKNKTYKNTNKTDMYYVV